VSKAKYVDLNIYSSLAKALHQVSCVHFAKILLDVMIRTG